MECCLAIIICFLEYTDVHTQAYIRGHRETIKVNAHSLLSAESLKALSMELYSERLSAGGHCFGIKGITMVHVKHRFYLRSPDNSGKLERRDRIGVFDGRRDITRRKAPRRYFLVRKLIARRLSAICQEFQY